MFVAYTRAKKRLIIYKAERERALSQSSIYIAPDYPALRYTEPKPGLDKYYLSYTAQSRIFENVDSYVLNQIKKTIPYILLEINMVIISLSIMVIILAVFQAGVL